MTVVDQEPTLIKVSVGPRNAYIDERGLRKYVWKGLEYPSVTTIRRMAGMPFPLHEWAIKEVCLRAIERYRDLGQILEPGTADAALAARKWLRAASVEKRDAAARLGTAVHDAASEGRALTEVSADVAPFLRHYQDWLAVSGAEIIATEKQVFNLTVGFAGTFDSMVRFRNQQRWIVDLKTGKGIYPEHALQCLAYAMGEFIGEDDVVDEQLTSFLKDITGIAILHLRDDGWEWDEVVVTPELWKAFQSLLGFAVWADDNQNMDKLTRGRRTGAAA